MAHNALRQSLQGQRVTIPSIYMTFPEWKPRLHQDYQKARDNVLNPWIQKWVVDKSTARALQAAEFGVFAAVWCPDAPFDVLCTAAKYFAWYFVYDDIFDCGALKHDRVGASNYRTASLQYFKFSLLGEGDAPDLTCFDITLRNGVQCWDEIGQHICQVCSRSTREVLCDEMLRYVGSLNNVDSIFADYDTPSIEEYWERREDTAAAHCVIATLPFIYGVDIDRSDVQEQSMKDLWRHTSYFVHITNDMLSMRKEVNHGQIENLIPLLMLNENIDCDAAMNQSYRLLHNKAVDFRQTKLDLLEKSQQHSKVITDMFIEGCLNIAMGLAHWSYSGDRYFKFWERDAENVIRFTMKLPKLDSKVLDQARRFKSPKDYILLLRLPLWHTLLTFVQFSPLVMLTVATMVPRLGILLPSLPRNLIG